MTWWRPQTAMVRIASALLLAGPGDIGPAPRTGGIGSILITDSKRRGGAPACGQSREADR